MNFTSVLSITIIFLLSTILLSAIIISLMGKNKDTTAVGIASQDPPQKWTYDEIIIAAYMNLYGSVGLKEDFYKEFSIVTGRTPSAIKRKMSRLSYLDTDNGSEKDKEIMQILTENGELRSLSLVFQSAAQLSPDYQWINTYVNN